MKSNTITIISAAVASVIISISTLAVINDKSDKYHIARMADIKDEFSSNSVDDGFDEIQRNRERRTYTDNINNMVYRLGDLPDTADRTQLLNNIIKVIKDDVISDDEYHALKTGFRTLEQKNIIDHIQETATKFVD